MEEIDITMTEGLQSLALSEMRLKTVLVSMTAVHDRTSELASILIEGVGGRRRQGQREKERRRRRRRRGRMELVKSYVVSVIPGMQQRKSYRKRSRTQQQEGIARPFETSEEDRQMALQQLKRSSLKIEIVLCSVENKVELLQRVREEWKVILEIRASVRKAEKQYLKSLSRGYFGCASGFNYAEERKQKKDRWNEIYADALSKYRQKIYLLSDHASLIQQDVICFNAFESERCLLIQKLLMGPARQMDSHIEKELSTFSKALDRVVSISLAKHKLSYATLLKELQRLKIGIDAEFVKGRLRKKLDSAVGFKMFGYRSRLDRFKGESEVYFPMYSIEELLQKSQGPRESSARQARQDIHSKSPLKANRKNSSDCLFEGEYLALRNQARSSSSTSVSASISSVTDTSTRAGFSSKEGLESHRRQASNFDKRKRFEKKRRGRRVQFRGIEKSGSGARRNRHSLRRKDGVGSFGSMSEDLTSDGEEVFEDYFDTEYQGYMRIDSDDELLDTSRIIRT